MTERTRESIIEIINQAKDTIFYKELLIPELDRLLAFYDERACGETDPWKRYGSVEAYKALKNFKLALTDAGKIEDEEE